MIYIVAMAGSARVVIDWSNWNVVGWTHFLKKRNVQKQNSIIQKRLDMDACKLSNKQLENNPDMLIHQFELPPCTQPGLEAVWTILPFVWCCSAWLNSFSE